MKRVLRLASYVLMALALIAGAWLLSPPSVHAQVNEGLNALAPTIRLSSSDPRVIAARIINVALGLLGIIFLVLVIYAGFLWMTSGGDSGKTDQAKTLLRNAIIGLIIILSSWAITRYVIERLLEATNNTGGGTSQQDDGGSGGGFGGGGAFSSFQVRAISPNGSLPIRNIRVRFIFTRDVDPSLVSANLHVYKATGRVPVDGTWNTSGSVVEFVPSAPCPGAETERCFDGDTDFIAVVDRNLRSLARPGEASQRIVCGGLAPACEGTFRTGNLIDTLPPSATILIPYEGQSVPQNDTFTISTRASDDVGISYVSSSADGRDIGVDTPTSTRRVYTASVSWSTRGVATGTHMLRSSASDLDSHSALSQTVNVAVRPPHCFNGRQDEDEIGLDCGGSSCGACAGGACTRGTDCRSGMCGAGGVCVEQPVILDVSPNNGKAGTVVTITGANFGRDPGQVRFWDGSGFRALATPPAACAVGSTWQSGQIIVQVPPSARTGPIQVLNTSSTLVDATNDRNGPALDDYTVNDVARPGLCAITPSSGERGDALTLTGIGLGTTPGLVFFADRDVTPSAFSPAWSDTRLGLNAPVAAAGTYPVRVRVGTQDSNPVAFALTERVRGNPVIESLDPVSGPIGEYVTLTGRNFGATAGRVVFRNVGTGEVGNADITFPPACSREFWRDTVVTVKVPPTVGLRTAVTPGAYQVYVIRQGDGSESNRSSFAVNTATPRPGICAITPIAGPVGTVLSVSGERFGGRTDTLSFQGSAPGARVNASTISTWMDGSITATVPAGSYTGPVRVTVGTSASNGVNFAVRNCNEDAAICGVESCCRDSGQCSVRGVCAEVAASSHYAWQMSTGQLPLYPEVIEECAGRAGLPPSPSPWDNRSGGSEVCVNAELVVRFNTAIDHATLTSRNIVVSRCTASGDNPCSRKEPVSGRFELGYSDGVGPTRRSMLTFVPDGGTWAANATYDIAVTTGVVSEGRIAMRALERCGAGVGYCFRFKTRVSTESCRLGSVGVTPNPFSATDLGERVNYRGNALSADDQCIQINPATLSWRWYTGRSLAAPDSRATLSTYTGVDCPLTGCPWRQVATAQNETGPTDPVRVNAQSSNPGDAPVVGTGNLFIQFIPPRVVTYGPNCNEACTEAKIWAEFNVPMDPTYATDRQVLLYRCANENCRSFSPSTPLVLGPGSVRLVATHGRVASPANRRIEIDPVDRLGASYLEPGAFYKVILRGDIDPARREGFRSRTGLALTELNDRQGFSWRFRVKEDNRGLCDVTRVDVVPVEEVETVVAARELFSANPVHVSQACGEQFLMSRGSYAWTTEFADVSKFINGTGDGMIDTNPVLPPNCSGRCTNVGSEGVDGRIASCGNSLVETTDASSCRRAGGGECRPDDRDCVLRLDPAQRCRVLTPGSRGGEECDLGDATSGGLNGVRGGLCGIDCLWAGVDGGSCGNGVVEAGEQCDPGRVCIGGARAGTSCVRDDACGEGGRCGLAESTGCSARCLALGSSSVTTVGEDSRCGNRSVGAGETCDDGNLDGGDGCSNECLHEGSRPVVSMCGNRTLEPGESCERASDGGWPSGCNRTTCLNEGTNACPATGDRVGCCGNGTREVGEDCDDRNSVNGDGCSQRCLAEGSSIGYRPTASICGDGIRGVGEQCEAERGDGATDGRQLSEIVGEREPDPSGRMMSRVRATYRSKTGEGAHGLQCGFTEEVQCEDLAEGRSLSSHGLTSNGCCMERPRVTTARFPLAGAQYVCRNTEISFNFSQMMDPESIQNNFFLAQEITTGSCPAGTRAIVPEFPRACVGGLTGRLRFETADRGTRVIFALDRALQATTTYRIIVRGDDDLRNSTSTSVRNTRGVVMAGNTSWTFKTGDRICAANNIIVRDTHPDRPFLFQQPRESHAYTASVMSIQNGVAVPISSVEEYAWRWQPWLSSDTRVLTVGESESSPAQQASTSTLVAQNRSGSSLVFAGIRITRDTVNLPSTSGTTLEAARLSTVSLCERPWPAVDPRYNRARQFSDSRPLETEPSVLTGTIFENGPYYNFATNYCLDQGEAGVSTDDLPSLTIRPTPRSTADASRGLLRQYLFTFEGGSMPARFRKDAIGIRVFENPLHLSPQAWYTAQGFEGSPSALTVDGYEAIKEGGTLYVAAPNVDASTRGPVTSTIYVISRNPDAEVETVDIFDQLVSNWVFNVNIERDASNVCKNGDEVFVSRNRTVACTADWECAAYGDALTCASFKSKIQRDGKRLADFQTLMTKLEQARTRDGRYPVVASGSYLQGITNSRWGSWQSVLGAALGGNVPLDPVNRFLTCGRCQYPGVTTPGEPCADATDCRTGGTCVGVPRAAGAAVSYDPATCWEPTNRRFLCPRLPSGPSRFYQYRSLAGGTGYELGTELEAASYDRYRPALPTGANRCSNTGQLCQSDDQCITYYAGTTRERSRGTCQPSGGQWRYTNVCTGREFGIDAICGNGIRSAGEACEVGDTATAACVTGDGRPGMKQQICSPTCQSFVDGPTTRCVAVGLCGNGRVDRNVCDGPGVKYGQSCSTPTSGASPECTDARDPSGSVMRCVAVSSIPRAGAEEVCDDGALNGTYGRCNRTCTGYDSLCGDGELSPGESCDEGAANGQYNGACSFDCRARGPFCGDRILQDGDGEQCEPGQVDVTTSPLCSTGPRRGQPCNHDDGDCSLPGVSGRCGTPGVDGIEVEPLYGDCRQVTANRCIGAGTICEQGDRRLCSTDRDCEAPGAGGRCVPRFQVSCDIRTPATGCGPAGRCNSYPTRRVRTCGPVDSENPSERVAECRWAGWSACQPAGTCGDGTQDTGEECDDGNTNDNDSCTTLCKLNVCGDNFLYRGVEQCDYGSQSSGGRNGLACSSEYGASCASCSMSCRVEAQSGGFCGNARRDGREQCDFVGACVGGPTVGARCTSDGACGTGGRCAFDGIDPSSTCRALGFDYANRSMCDTNAYIANRDGSIVCVNTGSTTECVTCELEVSALMSRPGMSRRDARLIAELTPDDGRMEPGGGGVGGVGGLLDPTVRVDVWRPEGEIISRRAIGVMTGGSCRACRGGDCVYRAPATAQPVTPSLQIACRAGTVRDYLSCSTSCGFAGCGSCLAAPVGENATTLEGDVYDQDANVPIPGARVVVTYRGNRVADTVADGEGRFRVDNLHARRECGQYRVVVSFERDNPRTTSLEAYGYRPFDSGLFTPLDFSTRVTQGGRINLAARADDSDGGASRGGVLEGETRVIVTWSGALPLATFNQEGTSGRYVRAILPHLIVPSSKSFVKQAVRVGNTFSCASLHGSCRLLGDGNIPIACERTPLFSGIACAHTRDAFGGAISGSYCCPDREMDTSAIARMLSIPPPGGSPVSPTTENIAAARAIACCQVSTRTSNNDGVIIGYPTSTACGGSTPACSSNSALTDACCRRDLGTATSWQGFAPMTQGPGAIISCPAHRVTTQAHCDALRAGTVMGIPAVAQGPTGYLTELACNPNNTCDEFVRESTPTSAMSVRFLRSRRVGEVYRFYLEQYPYANVTIGEREVRSRRNGSPCTELDWEVACSAETVTACPPDSRDPNVCYVRRVSSGGVSTPAQYMSREIALEVRVLNGRDEITIRPLPDPGITCDGGVSPSLWLAFEQNAQTGQITVPNGGNGQYVCGSPEGMTGLNRGLNTTSYTGMGMGTFPRPDFAP